MAGNFFPDKNGNIYVEFDVDNIIVVDPNKTIDDQGNVKERLVDPENMVMYANLEAELLPRTKMAVGYTPDDPIRTISIASINFLSPTEGDYFSTGYYDEITGEKSTTGKGVNQTQSQASSGKQANTQKILSGGKQGSVDSGLLGLTKINMRLGTSFIPSVTITLEDVQGKALFQLGQNSPYAAFFNLPYPPFYLTLKGFYGQAVRYQLNLEKFNARFNSYNGNYEITLELKGYKFNILNEISMGHIFAVPHMYSTRFDVKSSDTNVSNNNDSVTQLVSEKGYQKIKEVYSEYKAKNLIPPDFPELTFLQLMNKVNLFEQTILNSYDKADVKPLTDIRNYKTELVSFFNQVYADQVSWFNQWCDTKRPYVTSNNEKYYVFKSNIKESDKETAVSKLKSIIDITRNELNRNPTVGERGKSRLIFDITENTIVRTNLDEIDVEKTAKEWFSTSVITDDQRLEVIDSFNLLKIKVNTTVNIKSGTEGLEDLNPFNKVLPYYYFTFNDFISKTKRLDTDVSNRLGSYETDITADLAKKIESKSLGIGFRPSVRNVIAVIMASTEAFIRLLDDVHTQAWDVRYDPIRKNAILKNNSSAIGSDYKNVVNTSTRTELNNPNYENSQVPVYPWPQFFVETNEDKKGRFQLKYIGDPSVVDLTQGGLTKIWPEVQFVEEYLKGANEKFNPPISQPPTESDRTTNIQNINAIEFPIVSLAYANKEEIRFFYELYERQYLTTFYTGLGRVFGKELDELITEISDFESENIYTSLGISNPYLSFSLKNQNNLNSNNYVSFLKKISNDGTGRFFQEFERGFFVTPYIKSNIDTSSSILELTDIGPTPEILKGSLSDRLLKIISSSAMNEKTLMDTYPFTDETWCQENLVGIDKNNNITRYNTNKYLTVYEDRGVISNFNDIENTNKNRPVTNFYYQKPISYTPNVSVVQDRTNLPPTVGMVFNPYPSKKDGQNIVKDTSLLNTPYFINSILKGVDLWRRNVQSPYKTAAYIFINSLPLITLRERTKTLGSVMNNDDYFFASLKKFGAIHKLPYAWLLKIGSLWHRYKTYKETNIDFVNDVWNKFDYVRNYDPKTTNPQKTYSYRTSDGSINNIQMESVQGNSISMNVGFYPKLINDFNTFYNGYDLFKDYSSSEVQNAVNNGMMIYNYPESNLNNISQGSSLLTLKTSSVIIPSNIQINVTEQDCKPPIVEVYESNYIVPSWGTNLNRVKDALCTEIETDNPKVIDGYSITSNSSVFNGSVRTVWGNSNYGYFDSNVIKKPEIDSYLTKVRPNANENAPFELLPDDTYTKIDDLLAVFDKDTLDLFENEFLNWSKPITDIAVDKDKQYGIGEIASNPNEVFRNFQMFFRQCMKVSRKKDGVTDTVYFDNIISEQFNSFNSNVRKFLEYDVIFRFGNPLKYDKRVFDSFVSYRSTNPIILNPIEFEPYVNGSLPTKGGIVTLQQSKQNYPKEWIALETNVGFSTVNNLQYSNNGSYITDFFVDNNIKFSVNNIVVLSQLIKIYATQKLQNPNITQSDFRNKVIDYNNKTSDKFDLFLDGVIKRAQAKIPNYSQVSESTIKSVVDGQQSKVMEYEMFKAINDKWIAGGDYKNKTLFEDLLFLDRASRNIGDTLLVDIFDLQKVLDQSAINMKMSVYTYIAGILINNNFNIMNLPAYVNFYNVQNIDGTNLRKPEGSLDFANNLWGTFLNVDYRNSAPKMVCFYVGKPSNYLALPDNNVYGFRDDGFDMSNGSQSPLLENLQNKQDWALSNRCVGFNVDIGIRNQNIFYQFSVGQENGKSTAEVVNTIYNMIDNTSGRNVATQNQSLYELYLQRSYTCTVTSIGNAMIQPTMYFNLRHVPMFYGPYMILDVEQSIGPGSFQTTFTGIRQGFFDLPSIDKYLQSINQNLLTKLEAFVLNKQEKVPKIPVTDSDKLNNTVKNSETTKQPTSSCQVLPKYLEKGYINVESVNTYLNKSQFVSTMDRILSTLNINDNTLRASIYSICYLSTFDTNGQKFNGYNNNYALQYSLTEDYYPTAEDTFEKTYSCYSNNNDIKSTPNFLTSEKFFSFIISRLKNLTQRITDEGLYKFYCCYFPTGTQNSPTYFDSNKDSDIGLKSIRAKLVEGLLSAQSAGIKIDNTEILINGTFKTEVKVESEVIVTCLPPVINYFDPIEAKSNLQAPKITIVGSGLWGNTTVTIGGYPCSIESLDTESRLVVIPKTKNSGKITVTTDYGTYTSTQYFTFIP